MCFAVSFQLIFAVESTRTIGTLIHGRIVRVFFIDVSFQVLALSVTLLIVGAFVLLSLLEGLFMNLAMTFRISFGCECLLTSIFAGTWPLSMFRHLKHHILVKQTLSTVI